MVETRSPSEVEARAAQALRRIARDQDVKEYVLTHPPLYAPLLRAASRYIGGETLSGCLDTASALNRQGLAVTIDYMGESTRDAASAEAAADEFLRVGEAIRERGVDASLSLDLSHIGLAVDEALAFENARRIAHAAVEAGTEVMISMEGSERTDAVLELHGRLCERFTNVGVTLQAYLYRTADDLATALERPGKIRLVKGAFEEPPGVARGRGTDLDAAYRAGMERLLASGHSCSIATHDPALLEHAHTFIQRRNLERRTVEFEMLHGVTPDRLQHMRELGYRVRAYLPYGTEWYLYLCHRLAEYPPNLFRAVADAVDIPGPRPQ
jgi:proline dehydrogenase